MKRVGTFVITSVFLALLWCTANYDASIKEIVPPEIPEISQEQEKGAETEVLEETSDAVVPEEADNANTSEPEQKPQPNSTVKDYDAYNSVAFEQIEEIKQTVVDKITTEVIITSNHKPVGEEAYYQYADLNNTERLIYGKIVEAIKETQNIVNVRQYSCSAETIRNVYEHVVADYPQFFYLAKSYHYTCIMGSRNINQLILRYSDGVTEDCFDSEGNLTTKANRDRISQQICTFNEKVASIIKSIPDTVSDIEKEKRIYDYLQENIVYDTGAAQLASGSYAGVVPHAYDAYGAACEGNAVCEGYAKLFQYLCYCVGINATQIYGTSMDTDHMWNAVCIGDEWYMLDVTWDDSGMAGLHCYQYFNLTTSQIEADHHVSTTSIRVPSCNSTTYEFYNYYAMYVEDDAMAPMNYGSVLEYLAGSSDKYLCVYINNQVLDVGKYISRQLLAGTSDVQRYIKTKNYSIALANMYYQIGNYCYISLQ